MAELPNSKKYGVPLYGASWVPSGALTSADREPPATKEGEGDGPSNNNEDRPSGDESFAAENCVVLAGGGGSGCSGIPNAVLISHFEFASNSLSDEPVAKLGTGDDLPYRMAVHPRGDGVVCALQESCRLFEWEAIDGNGGRRPGLKSSDRVLDQLQAIGQQLAIAFNDEGSSIALGGEDGKLRVFKWPSMEVIINEDNVHASVKDLDFSPDGKYLVSVGSGPGRVWDVTSSNHVASLPKENDERLCFCRFSLNGDGNQILYITVMRSQGVSIAKWDTSSWKKVSSKHIVGDPVSAFDVSDNGKLLAIGTVEGNVIIVDSASMSVRNIVKKAHLGVVTALAFSKDSRALISASLDSSARVTIIKDAKKSGSISWVFILIILLAIAAYYLMNEGFILRRHELP